MVQDDCLISCLKPAIELILSLDYHCLISHEYGTNSFTQYPLLYRAPNSKTEWRAILWIHIPVMWIVIIICAPTAIKMLIKLRLNNTYVNNSGEFWYCPWSLVLLSPVHNAYRYIVSLCFPVGVCMSCGWRFEHTHSLLWPSWVSGKTAYSYMYTGPPPFHNMLWLCCDFICDICKVGVGNKLYSIILYYIMVSHDHCQR